NEMTHLFKDDPKCESTNPGDVEHGLFVQQVVTTTLGCGVHWNLFRQLLQNEQSVNSTGHSMRSMAAHLWSIVRVVGDGEVCLELGENAHHAALVPDRIGVLRSGLLVGQHQ